MPLRKYLDFSSVEPCVIPLPSADKLPFVILLQEALCSQAAIDGTCPTLCRSNRVVYQLVLRVAIG